MKPPTALEVAVSRPRTRTAAALLVGALALSACAGGESDDPGAAADVGTTDDTADGETTTDDAEEPTASDAADDGAADDGTSDDGTSDDGASGDGDSSDADETGEEAAPAGPEAAVLATPATAPDGSTFTIGDFAGQPVFVETFATWCSSCRRQLGATQQAAVEAGGDAVFLILSVETTIDPATLATYAEEQGFDELRFGRLDEQGLATFDAAFGRSVLNPPSTPKFRVTADGDVSELTTGMESVEEILATLPS